MKIVNQNHVTRAEIEQAFCGGLETVELRRLVSHLIHCPSCRRLDRPGLTWLAATLDAPFGAGEPPPEALDPSTDAAYDQALDRALSAAKRQIPVRLEEKEWQQRLVAAEQGRSTFRLDGPEGIWAGDENLGAPSGAVVEALLTLSHEMRYRDPEGMRDFALSAVFVVKRMGKREQDQGRYTQPQIVDLQVRALGELANAYRLTDDFEEADSLLAGAFPYLAEAGSGDAMIEIRLLDILASLRTDQRQLGEALDLLDEVHERYLEMGETHLAGRALISRGIASAYADLHREAASLLQRGLALIDPERDPKLATHGQYYFLSSLVLCDKFQEARQTLLTSGLGQAFASDTLNLLKLKWLEGKIYAGLRKHQQAEERLSEAKAGMLSLGRGYEAAMVSLELIAVYLRQRKADAAETQAEEALEAFRHLKVGYEAFKAVLYLREACRIKVASAAMVETVLRFLQKLERDPAVLFVPGLG